MATITTANGGLDVCIEALVLLRQDRELPVKQDGSLDTTSDVVAKKVDRVYDSTRALVIGAHGWDGLTLDEHGDNTDIANSWPKQIRAAFVALLARELALPVTGRQEDLKAMHELYQMKLSEAVKKDFEEAVGKETDKLTLAVYAVCKGYLKDGEPLPWSWAGFKARVGDAANAAKMEVDNALKWSSKFTGAADDWRYPAYERLVTAKMAASVGAGVEQQNLLLQAYKVELETAKKKDLETSIAAETDKLVLAVYATCKGYLKEGEPLPWSWGAFKARVGDAANAAKMEVDNALKWSSKFEGAADDWRYPAYERLVTAKMAASVGAGVEQQNLLLQAYKVELETAKKKDLETSIAAETDKLTLAVYATCKGYLKDGEPLPWSWAGFKGKIESAKGSAKVEIEAAHDWCLPFKEDERDWRYPAYERLVTAKMAASVGAGVEQQNSLFQAYRLALNDAARKDWNEGVRYEADPFVRHVFGEVQVHMDAKSSGDVSYRRMRESFNAVKDGARIEVLAERDWNFARRSADVMAAEDGYQKWSATLPHDCLKVHDVEGHDGIPLAKDGWWMEDGFLKCHGREPVRITYTADMKNVERWDPLVRRVYVALLMRKLALSAPEARIKVQVLDADYRDALAKAAIKEARETQPGKVSWGENDYANAIRGFQGFRVSRFQGCRGGYVR